MAWVDLPIFEQLPAIKATWIAGTNMVDNNKGIIYMYLQTATTTCQFWRYDTVTQWYQQLANPPTQTGTVANMVYTEQSGWQFSWVSYWAIYLFVRNGTINYLYRYNEATNAWSANLGTTNIPANFSYDCYLVHPWVARNNFEWWYHSGILRTITNTRAVALWATSITVSATSEQMAIWTRLRFWAYDITISANADRWATTINVWRLAEWISAWTQLLVNNWDKIYLKTNATALDTTLTVYPLQSAVNTTDIIKVQQYVTLTSAATSWATSLSIDSSYHTIESNSNALYYWQMYLVGNNSTQMYRWNIWTATWSTTSANSWNPALTVVPWTVAYWCWLKWLPAFYPDKLFLLRWNWSSNAYYYDLVSNTWTSEAFYQVTEGFTTWTSVASRSIWWKQSTILIQKDSTWRVYERHPVKNTLEPYAENWSLPNSGAVVWDKSCCITTPDWLEYYYIMLNSNTYFVRCLLLDI